MKKMMPRTVMYLVIMACGFCGNLGAAPAQESKAAAAAAQAERLKLKQRLTEKASELDSQTIKEKRPPNTVRVTPGPGKN
ncbi:MAG: hypothetical protein KBC91_06075 [Candidatus Omnitrophica bacterium]|nr:hypothetical protein [Candidatus Omnitrophota bacterium]